MIFDNVIVGSGISAFGAYLGLREKNETVCMIDIGFTINSKQLKLDDQKKSKIKASALKTKFGSDFAYMYPEKNLSQDFIPISGAFGGFSTVWGAGLQTLSQQNLEIFSAEIRDELEYAQGAILKEISHLHTPGRFDLISPWPLGVNSNQHPYALSEAIKDLYENYNKALSKTNQFENIYLGYPRLAVDADVYSKNSCVLCNKCLDGCPTNSIFDSSIFFEKELKGNKLKYIKGYVTNVTFNNDLINVQYKDGNEDFNITSKKVFLAAGPISSAIILLKSKIIQNQIVVQDSQVFYKYFMSRKLKKNVSNFALSHGILSYTSSDILEEFFISFFPFSESIIERIPLIVKNIFKSVGIYIYFIALLKRVIPSIGFLPSEVSGKIIVKIDNFKNINIEKIQNEKTYEYLKKVDHSLKKVMNICGFFNLPIKFPFKPEIGTGVHIGSSLPLGGEHVDLDGSFRGFKNLYLVDASVLPRIFPGGHSLATMANAYRIALTSHKDKIL